ncbi:hypothetical protein CJ030_MR1G001436 [Morella rubra]|uniref:RNase H type-1 domain-containing protein n=1 Tax=Morella rubra TaxID=262757 RepID=A0A6A1WUZ3_9ROSI|nr:hypothetical protein CJ030_MR1G001436 [Morella rubra]
MDVIWYSCNQVLHGGRRDDIGTIIRRIHRLFVEHSKAWSALVPTKSFRWSPHCGIRWKINFDVGIRSHCSMIAAVCRNSAGSLLFAWTKRRPPGTPLVGEARAAFLLFRRVVCLVNFSLTLKVTICRSVTLSLPLFSPDWSIGSLVQDNKTLLEVHTSWTVSHVGRDANRLAHKLSQWAVLVNLEGNTPMHCIPPDILNSDDPPPPPS